ncbi:MAG: PaREP1 family protein [Sulfolobales archaeon]
MEQKGSRPVEIDLEGLSEKRASEAVVELELAEKLLRAGLLRNAAGKAFQAWKSYLSHLALSNIDKLKDIEGYRKLPEGRVIERYKWVAAVMPTNMMSQIAVKLSDIDRDIVELTLAALAIHEYQYNGPDREGIMSRFYNDETAERAIKVFIERVRDKISKRNRSIV